ncbi:MAG TPA: ribose 5-phosphate isomerase B [Anaerolineales bacterium]|nr:ribose 5-phosphate isomerase B [Anaerolineales bacterium]
MTDISDAELHEIVRRVLQQVMGSSTREPVSTNSAAAQSQTSGRKAVAIGADHGGFELKEALKVDLNALGFDIQDVGTNSKDAVDYPDFAHAVAQAVSSGKAWRGIMIDGAGIGSCIVANKVPGVRAGMAYDYSSAVNSREHNDTNVLTLGAGLIGMNLAKQIVKTWLTTEFAGGRHTPRVDKIKSVEKKYLK